MWLLYWRDQVQMNLYLNNTGFCKKKKKFTTAKKHLQRCMMISVTIYSIKIPQARFCKTYFFKNVHQYLHVFVNI